MIRINKNNSFNCIIFFLIICPILSRFVIENFKIGDYSILIIMDIIAYLFVSLSMGFKSKRTAPILYLILIVAVCCTLIGLLINGFALSLLFKGIRRYYRLFVAIHLGIIYFSANKWENFLKILHNMFYLNGILMVIQFVFFGLKQDWIGGIFGNTPGCNGIQNVLFCIITIYYVVCFMYKRCSISKMVLHIILCILFASLAELTIYFFELVMIVGLAVLVCNKSVTVFIAKKLPLILGSIILIIFGVFLYMKIFPERMFLLDFNNILNYLGAEEGTTGVYKISRIRVFSQLGNRFFDTNLSYLFGFGLGNCSNGSTFYRMFWDSLRYSEISSAIEFLENGMLGICLLAILLIYFLITNYSHIKKLDKTEFSIQIPFTFILSSLCIVWFFYNSVLTDIYTSYLIGLFLGGGLGIMKGEIKKNDSQKNSLYLVRK